MVDRNMTTLKRLGQVYTREGMLLELPPSDFFDVDNIPGIIDPFAHSTTKEFPLGTKLTYADRVFRYFRNGGTILTMGKLQQSVVPLAGHITEVIGTHGVGSKTIDFTPNTDCTDDLVANELADAYIIIDNDAGEGGMYRIKSHPAIAGAVSGVLTLYDPVVVAIGAAATATILHHAFDKTIIHPSINTARIVGCSVSPVAANSFGWLQTNGPCPVLIDGTVIIGQHVRASDGVDGAVELLDRDGTAEDDQEVGVTLAVVATSLHGPIHLTLE